MSDNGDNRENGGNVPRDDADLSDNSARQNVTPSVSITSPPETPSATDCSLPNSPHLGNLDRLRLASSGSSSSGELTPHSPGPSGLAFRSNGSSSPRQLSSTHSPIQSPLAMGSSGFRSPRPPSSLAMSVSNSPKPSPTPSTTSDTKAKSKESDPSRAGTSSLPLHERRTGEPIIELQIGPSDESSEPQDIFESNSPGRGSGNSQLGETHSGRDAGEQTTPEKADSGIKTTDSSDSVFVYEDNSGLMGTGSDSTQPVEAVSSKGTSEHSTQTEADSGIETTFTSYSSTGSSRSKRGKAVSGEHGGKRFRRTKAASGTTASVAGTSTTGSGSSEPLDVVPDKDASEPSRQSGAPAGSTAAVSVLSITGSGDSEPMEVVPSQDAGKPSRQNGAAAGSTSTAGSATAQPTVVVSGEDASEPSRQNRAASRSTSAVTGTSTAGCGWQPSQHEEAAPAQGRVPGCTPCCMNINIGEQIAAVGNLCVNKIVQAMQAGSTIVTLGHEAMKNFKEDLATNKEQGVTHMQGNLFMDSHCFLVSKERLEAAAQKNLDLGRLGVLVKFKDDCRKPGLLCDDPDACRACPHKFGCSCPIRYQEYAWCPHIHVAEKMALKSPKMHICIHEYDSSSAEMRHLRAWVQGKDFMERIGDDEFKEKLSIIPESERQTIKVVKSRPDYKCDCEPDQKCEVCWACYCRYKCTCDDWARNQRTCQHCHWVAMEHFETPGTEPFDNLPQTTSFQKHAPKDNLVSLRVTKDHKLAMELRHELSYNIDDKLMTDSYDRTSTEWTFPNDIKVTRQRMRECRCDETNTCPHCKICVHNFQCTCDDGNLGKICWHQHYVGRRFAGEEKTLQERWNYHRRTTLLLGNRIVRRQ